MAEDEMGSADTSGNPMDAGARVQELIVKISEYLDEEPDLSSFKDGTAAEVTNVYTTLRNNQKKATALYSDLEEFFHTGNDEGPGLEEVRAAQGPIPERDDLLCVVEKADACCVVPEGGETESGDPVSLEANDVDLIITSPPYWKKRNYEVEGQLGHESSPEEYVDHLIRALDRWRVFLRPTGSIFLNLGDTYRQKSLVGIPGRFIQEAEEAGWKIRNHIIWAKSNGLPSPVKDRLVSRHEHIFHLTTDRHEYFYDLFGYAQVYGNGSNPGDVWNMQHDQNKGGHLAPFPEELVRRAVTLACPPSMCPECGEPRRRELKRGMLKLNTDRPQAQRALEIYHESDVLTKDHLRAIQATGISDAGKAKLFQGETGGNAAEVEELATKAKEILGGYFREFTFPEWETKEWTSCECDVDPAPGLVFDPFAGSGTTLKVANELGYHAWGTDLDTTNFQHTVTEFG